MWIEPVTNRTSGNKGYLNAVDLNRIETDTKHLSELLNEYGYNQSAEHKTDWLMSDFPYPVEIERARTNVLALLNVYYEQDVPLPVNMEKLDWQKMNAVESNLKLMHEMIERMKQSFRYSGTFHCGQSHSF